MFPPQIRPHAQADGAAVFSFLADAQAPVHSNPSASSCRVSATSSFTGSEQMQVTFHCHLQAHAGHNMQNNNSLGKLHVTFAPTACLHRQQAHAGDFPHTVVGSWLANGATVLIFRQIPKHLWQACLLIFCFLHERHLPAAASQGTSTGTWFCTSLLRDNLMKNNILMKLHGMQLHQVAASSDRQQQPQCRHRVKQLALAVPPVALA